MRINVYKILPDLDLGNVYQILYKATNEHFFKKKKKDFNKQDWYPISNSETPNTMNVHRHPPPILLFNGVSLEAHEA